MVKKMLCILLVSIIGISATGVCSEEPEPTTDFDLITSELEKYKIIDENSFQGDEVTRGECIVAIMKTVGVDEGVVKIYETSDYYRPRFTEQLSWTEPFVFIRGYLLAAGYNDIAFGEGEGEIKTFNADKIATVQEALAFMARCLGCDSKDLSETFQKVVDEGLVLETDSFYKAPESPLTKEVFCILLYRMLYHPCYLYFDASVTFGKDVFISEDPSMRYIDVLEARSKLSPDQLIAQPPGF
jgi:hypothetical protein